VVKLFGILLVSLLLVSNCYAGEFTITYTDEQKEAFEAYVNVTMQEWTQHAFDDKCRRRMEAAISEKTNYNPSKLSISERDIIIKNLKLKKGELRNDH